jgi:flagellar motor switch protein FliM
MSKILTQEEIDALLSSAPGADVATRGSDPILGDVITYNFRRPDRVSKEQIRSLHFLHDRFARNVGTSLGAFLRTMTELSIVSVEQFSYSEFLMSLPDPTAFYAFGMAPFDNVGALELNPTIAYTMVDRMLGGTGRGPTPSRALTEIEQNIVDSVVKLILEHLTEAWRPVFELKFSIQGRETRPQMLQVVGLNEIVILSVFDLKVGDIRGMLNICIPASAIEATGSSFVQGWHRTRREPTPSEQQWLFQNLERVPLSVTTGLETRLTARELLHLGTGDVLTLGIPIETPVNIRVGGTLKFRGRLTSERGRAALVVEDTVDRGVLAAEGR